MSTLFNISALVRSIALAVVACSISHAYAGPVEGPFIQIDIEVGALDITETKVIVSRYTLVMDASIPAAQISTELVWYPITATLAISEFPVDGPQGLSPAVMPPPHTVIELEDPETKIGLGYNHGFQRFAIGGFFTDELFAVTNFVPLGFDDTTLILPSDYQAYISDGNQYNATAPGTLFVNYEDGLPFTFRVTIVDNPFPATSCRADFNSDGAVDFFDISAFIQAFSAGCE